MRKFIFCVTLLSCVVKIWAQAEPVSYHTAISTITSNNAVDPSLVETPITVKTLVGTISGTLTTPKDVSGKIPVVIIIPGTGPIDRDGNSNNGLNTNMYKLLAYALGKSGIASLRYDRRMVGQSTGN